jgi:hypothetical protein
LFYDPFAQGWKQTRAGCFHEQRRDHITGLEKKK